MKLLPLRRLFQAVSRISPPPARELLFVSGVAMLGVGFGVALGWGWGLVTTGGVFLLLSLRPKVD